MRTARDRSHGLAFGETMARGARCSRMLRSIAALGGAPRATAPEARSAQFGELRHPGNDGRDARPTFRERAPPHARRECDEVQGMSAQASVRRGSRRSAANHGAPTRTSAPGVIAFLHRAVNPEVQFVTMLSRYI